MITNVVRFFIRAIFRSIFISGDRWFKHSSILILIPMAVALVYNNVYRGILGSMMVLGIVIVMHTVMESKIELLYASVIALIPALWYILTSYPFTGNLMISAFIGLRVWLNGLTILTVLLAINPVEISFILSKFTKKSMVPTLIWKTVPHLLIDAENALLASKLKGEGIGKGLSVTILATIEYSRFYSEGLFTKWNKYKPSFSYSKKALVLHGVLLVINLAVIFGPFIYPCLQ